MTCFADTSYFLAALNPDDDQHEAALEWMLRPDVKVITTEFIFLELGNALSILEARQKFSMLLNRLRTNPSVKVVTLSSELMSKGESLFASRTDKEWSLTDCISFVVMKEQKLNDALTSDHHFAQAGFKVLLK